MRSTYLGLEPPGFRAQILQVSDSLHKIGILNVEYAVGRRQSSSAASSEIAVAMIFLFRSFRNPCQASVIAKVLLVPADAFGRNGQ